MAAMRSESKGVEGVEVVGDFGASSSESSSPGTSSVESSAWSAEGFSLMTSDGASVFPKFAPQRESVHLEERPEHRHGGGLEGLRRDILGHLLAGHGRGAATVPPTTPSGEFVDRGVEPEHRRGAVFSETSLELSLARTGRGASAAPQRVLQEELVDVDEEPEHWHEAVLGGTRPDAEEGVTGGKFLERAFFCCFGFVLTCSSRL